MAWSHFRMNAFSRNCWTKPFVWEEVWFWSVIEAHGGQICVKSGKCLAMQRFVFFFSPGIRTTRSSAYPAYLYVAVNCPSADSGTIVVPHTANHLILLKLPLHLSQSFEQYYLNSSLLITLIFFLKNTNQNNTSTRTVAFY